MAIQRSTKIVATLGPASSTPERLAELVAAGIDVVRLNFSHGTAEDHKKRIGILRDAAHKAGRTVGVMADLQGPKIRIGKFAAGPVTLKAGQSFILDAKCVLGDAGRCSTSSASRAAKFTAATGTMANCPTTRASTSRAADFRRRH
jgi:pyruvate kinase